MEFIFELFFQFFAEVVLQAVFELLAEFGFHALADTFKRPKHPALSAVGFAIWGTLAGAVSLLIFPHSPIDEPALRAVNLVVTPIMLGLGMAMLGKLRLRRGDDLVCLDRFGYAFLFAFFMGLVRYFFAG